MSQPGRLFWPRCVGLCLAITSLACATEPSPTCEELREVVGPDDEVVEGLSANGALSRLAAASPSTLTWHSPAILSDGAGVDEVELEHAGDCDTPVSVELELRDADIIWVDPEPELELHCGLAALLIPARLRFATDDGVLELERDVGVTVNETGELHFTVVLDGIPDSLGLGLGLDPARVSELLIEASLVGDELRGSVRLYSHDCTAEGACSYWADYLLGSFA